MNLGRQTQPWDPAGLSSAVEVHLLDRELDLEGQGAGGGKPGALLRQRQTAFPDNLEELSAQFSADAQQAAKAAFGLSRVRVISGRAG